METEKKRDEFQSQYQAQLNNIMQRINNREPFRYDFNADALYKQYANQYQQQGKMAMMDTMGQAAAMTGGYGNSYAQNVGQQAYQSHLGQMNNIIPELYQLALSKYQTEGDNLLNQYSMLSAQDNTDYTRYWNQKEFDESVRRYEFEHGLGEYAPTGESSSSSSYNPTGQEEIDRSLTGYDKRYESEEERQKKLALGIGNLLG